MEITDEMREAMRILKEDMTQREFAELRTRLDQMEDKRSERDAEWAEKFQKMEGSGEKAEEKPEEKAGEKVKGGDGQNGVPTPPPVVEPPAEPVKEGKKRWYERGNYAS